MTSERAFEPEPTLDSFGARLAIIRWSMGWNLSQAALACRLKESNWREWERTGRSPRNVVEVAQRISDRTNYSDYWIMTGVTPGGTGPTRRTCVTSDRPNLRLAA